MIFFSVAKKPLLFNGDKYSFVIIQSCKEICEWGKWYLILSLLLIMSSEFVHVALLGFRLAFALYRLRSRCIKEIRNRFSVSGFT